MEDEPMKAGMNETSRMIRAGVLVGLMLGCAAAADVGCASAHPSGAGAATSSSGGDDGGAGRGDGGPAPSCIPSKSTFAVADACGVFVSSSKGSDTMGDGSKEEPYATLTKALAEANGQPVYVCGESFTETVWLPESATLYGGLDCTKGWVYDASTQTQLTTTADAIPLSISTATTSAEVFDFAITSASALQPGGSSIAVLVAQAAVSF